jgi:thioredoxin reductase
LNGGELRARQENLPIAIIGAGPIGLAMAAHLAGCDRQFVILEAGPGIGHAISQWRHVRLFTEWDSNIDKEAEGLLAASGWRRPVGTEIPTGDELLSGYLEPLSRLPGIGPSLRFGHRVTAITRKGVDKAKTAGRGDRPFLIQARTPAGEQFIEARAVIDASGTWFTNNPLHSAGIWTEPEQAAAENIRYGLPNVLGDERSRYAGHKTVVVGSGYSAINVILDLAELRTTDPNTRIVWVVRRDGVDAVLNNRTEDLLLAQGWLGQRLRALVAQGDVEIVANFRIADIERSRAGVGLVDSMGRVLKADMAVAATGFRPDLSIFRELRAQVDPVSEAVRRLAGLIDPNKHSCYTVPVHGLAELIHEETDFYVVGIKSYGRAPTFLLKTGYEQLRAVASALCGGDSIERAEPVCTG